MPRNIVFVAPFPSEITMRFVRAVARLEDVKLLGIVHTPPSGADRRLYDDMVRITDPLSTSDIIEATEILRRRHGQPVRILGILESLMVQLGEARAHFGVEGTNAHTADLFRDKSRMKTALAQAGLPVAKNALVHSVAEGMKVGELIGFPLVLKPPAGMGAKATFRVNSFEDLHRALNGFGVSASQPILAEEFLQGREYSYETFTTQGIPRLASISHYQPSCLEVLENPWMQWTCMLPREIQGEEYEEIHRVGPAAIRALGLENGMTHMEWFRRPDGSVAIGEIAQRPPGAQISLMTGIVHDKNTYRAWARSVVDNEFDGPWERKYSAGCAFLRGMGRGRVAAITGLHETHEAVGKWIVEARLPSIGQPRNDSYEGEGYITVRHEQTEGVQLLLKKIIETVKIHYA